MIGWFDAESAPVHALAWFENGLAATETSDEIHGALSASIGSFGLEAAGTVPVVAVLDASIGSFSLAATGTAPAQGVLDAPIGSFSLSSAGTVAVQGGLDASIGTFGIVATGEVVSETAAPPVATIERHRRMMARARR